MMLLFQYREPVLRLRETEQDLLIAALTGLTDEELAIRLNLGLPSVKKLWRSLFERASARPNLFPQMHDGLNGSGRGRQKRQFILNYVRDHPEELRPFDHKSNRRSAPNDEQRHAGAN
jgi:DNA-binding CsgD family transcriptional regulator